MLIYKKERFHKLESLGFKETPSTYILYSVYDRNWCIFINKENRTDGHGVEGRTFINFTNEEDTDESDDPIYYDSLMPNDLSSFIEESFANGDIIHENTMTEKFRIAIAAIEFQNDCTSTTGKQCRECKIGISLCNRLTDFKEA